MKARIEKKQTKRLVEVAPTLFDKSYQDIYSGWYYIGSGLGYWGKNNV